MYLAYLTAVTYGLDEAAERLKPLVPNAEEVTAVASARLLQPPTPIIRTKDGSEKDQGVREEDATVNWPLLTVPKSAFEGTLAETPDMGEEEYGEPAGDAWGDDLNLDDDMPGKSPSMLPLGKLVLLLQHAPPPQPFFLYYPTLSHCAAWSPP